MYRTKAYTRARSTGDIVLPRVALSTTIRHILQLPVYSYPFVIRQSAPSESPIAVDNSRRTHDLECVTDCRSRDDAISSGHRVRTMEGIRKLMYRRSHVSVAIGLVLGLAGQMAISPVWSQEGPAEPNVNLEGEAEVEAESEVEVLAVEGIAGTSGAHAAAAAASGNNALADTATSGSLSIAVHGGALPEHPVRSATAIGTADGAGTPGDQGPAEEAGGTSGASVGGVEGEAEAEVEVEAEAAVGVGSAVASGGSSGAVAAVGTGAFRLASGATRPIATDTASDIDVGTSTATSTSSSHIAVASPALAAPAGDARSRGEPVSFMNALIEALQAAPAPIDERSAFRAVSERDATTPDRHGSFRERTIEIDLEPGAVDAGRYGTGYSSADRVKELVVMFRSERVPSVLDVSGFDIAGSDEVKVSLNGTLLGFLSTGPDGALNTGDRFAIPVEALRRTGTNRLVFDPKDSAQRWGATNLRITTVTAGGPDATGGGGDTTPPVGAEARSEAEVEGEAVSEASVATGPGTAAAVASGGGAVGVVGDFAAADAKVSVATSATTSRVTEEIPALFTMDTASAMPMTASMSGATAPSGEASGTSAPMAPAMSGTAAMAGEAEAEAEAEATVEAEVGNNSAALASSATGGAGAAGLAATARVSASTVGSTSTVGRKGRLQRRNDQFSRQTDRFDGAVEFLGAEAEADAAAEATADENIELTPTFIEVGPQMATSDATGDASSESTTVLSGWATVFFGQDGQGMTSLPDRAAPLDPVGIRAPFTTASTGISNGETEAEAETEVEVEAEAEVGFNAAAAGAAAVAVQARNGVPPLPAESATATSASTSVFDNGENRFDDVDRPGVAPLGQRADSPLPALDLSRFTFELETEAEAEAEVGIGAGAAAAAAGSSGQEGILADTAVATSPFAAAAASAAGPIVSLSVEIPAAGQAGQVIAVAHAEDPECRGVSVAVAVAGVPTVSGMTNEQETSAEEPCAATVRVVVDTHPGDARAPVRLAMADQPAPEGEAGSGAIGMTGGAALEGEAETETETEAEAGYGVAAASAGAGATGAFSNADAKSSTSTLNYHGSYDL